MLLDGRVALVTGGGGGLGRAICETFSREGATVVVNDLDRAAADATAKACGALGDEGHPIVADVSDSGSVGKMFGTIAEQWGRLDVLVNNAGISASADRLDAPAESTWE